MCKVAQGNMSLSTRCKNKNVDKIFLPKKFKSQIIPTLKPQVTGAGDYSLAGNGLGLGAGGKESFFFMAVFRL